MFGESAWTVGSYSFDMEHAPADLATRVLEDTPAPHTDDPVTLDVRALGPPEPLTETLERVVDLPTEEVFVQFNDRAPQHLYPRLESRGFAYATEEYGDVVVTAIWHAD